MVWRTATKIGLAGLGVVMLFGAVGTGITGHTGLGRRTPEQPWQPDSVALLRDAGIVPLWALRQKAPTVPVDSRTEMNSASQTSCPASLEIQLSNNKIGLYFDSARAVHEVYVFEWPQNHILRHDIAADLSYTTVVVPIDSASPWLAADLDMDGYPEIISQAIDELKIHSAPDWRLRARFVWPGHNVVMNPTLVNIDDDPHMEIYATPNTFSTSRVVLIDYDTVLDSFVLIADQSAPLGAYGQPAVGDFDEDGRTEFISANVLGYGLWEWQDTALVYISQVGGPAVGNDFTAAALRPKPGGVLHALLGHSAGGGFRHYELIAPTGDNQFEIVHVFERQTQSTGVQPCFGADVDCDGLDELSVYFKPVHEIWQWDVAADSFVQGCVWDFSTFGTMERWDAADFDQDGTLEWATVHHNWIFRVLPDTGCVVCDTNGMCGFSLDCFCLCAADPVCDSVINVLDVVAVVDVAFCNGVSLSDPMPNCPGTLTDADCSGFPDVLDVVRFVNVAFRGADPATEFCDPCAP